MKILVACEESGTMSQALRIQGHEVTSCDLLETSNPEAKPYHYVGDVFDLLPGSWDALIAFPPCTYLCKARLWDNSPDRVVSRKEAVEFVRKLMTLGIPQIAIENPIGHLSAALRPPNQIVYPWWFGDPYRKEVCFWTVGLPPLIATCYNTIRKPISNHVNSRMSQSEKSRIKSSWKYYPLMVDAIVNQWFRLL
jgi:hypothetical protein